MNAQTSSELPMGNLSVNGEGDDRLLSSITGWLFLWLAHPDQHSPSN